MLDFNRSRPAINSISEQLSELINVALAAERQARLERKYLGASRLGVACSRALQYEFLSAGDGNKVDGGRIRIFEAGHLFEELMARWLRLVGFELLTEDESGEQFGFTVAQGKIAGHIDGVVIAAPSNLNIPCPALWEAKSMNSKSWKNTLKKGLTLSKPIYAAQIALYQAYMEPAFPSISQNPVIFTAINKDTAEIYCELIPFDAGLAQRMSDKAVGIIRAIEAGELLPRTFSSSDFYECKMCLYRNRCWGLP